MVSAHAARQQLSPEKVVAPCQVPVASPQRRGNNYNPSCSFCGVPLFSEHVALHRRCLRDRRHTPVRGQRCHTLAACPVGTRQRRTDHETGWEWWTRLMSSSYRWKTGRESFQHLSLYRASGANSGSLWILVQLGKSTGPGQSWLRLLAVSVVPRPWLCLCHFREWKNAPPPTKWQP